MRFMFVKYLVRTVPIAMIAARTAKRGHVSVTVLPTATHEEFHR